MSACSRGRGLPDRYALNLGSVALTIFDSGGTDTLDYSNIYYSQVLNLNAETFSNVNAGIGNLSIARGVIIENAIGGEGADILLGNAVGNVLMGNAGNDNLDGAQGNDVLDGGAGADIMNGGAGKDPSGKLTQQVIVWDDGSTSYFHF